MIGFLPLLLLAASTRVDLVNEVYQVPPNDWRYVDDVRLKQQPGLVAADFSVESGGGEIRLALMRRDDLERLRNGLPHGVISATSAGRAGSLSYFLAGPGDFVVVLDNVSDAPAKVHLRIAVDFNGHRGMVTQLSPQRQLAVIAISFAVFFGIVTFSARRLLRNIKR